MRRSRDNSLYLMSVVRSRDHEQRLPEGFAVAGKKLDIGEPCIHFHWPTIFRSTSLAT
jgi:hypothetical protein